MSSDPSVAINNFRDYLTTSTTMSPRSIQKYVSIVRRFLLDCNMSFNLSTINTWISQNNRSKSTYVYKYALKRFLLSLGKKQMAESLVPAKKHPRKKVFKFIPKETLSQIINSLEPKYKALALIQFKTGARVSEVLTIRAENIDFDINDNFIYITIGVNKSQTKGSKERIIKFSKKYESFLRSYIRRPFGYLFLPESAESLPSEKLIRLIENNIKYYDSALSKIGKWHHIDGFSSHYLRHLFADHFLKAGGDPVYLQKALGHEKIDTTMRYVSIEDSMVEDTMLRMEQS